MKLYELSTQYAQLVDMFENADDDMQESIKDTLDSIADSIEVKADSIARIMREMEVERDAIESEIKRLSDRANKIKKQHADLKKYLFDNFQSAGIDKMKSQLFSFTVKNNPPSVNVLDESLIPSEFMRTKTEVVPDKKAIAEVLKAKGKVEGCELVQTKTLSIK